MGLRENLLVAETSCNMFSQKKVMKKGQTVYKHVSVSCTSNHLKFYYTLLQNSWNERRKKKGEPKQSG